MKPSLAQSLSKSDHAAKGREEMIRVETKLLIVSHQFKVFLQILIRFIVT